MPKEQIVRDGVRLAIRQSFEIVVSRVPVVVTSLEGAFQPGSATQWARQFPA
jgi:hypothetical protein